MFQANQQIGSYTLIKQIGKGGFGEVWLAEKRSPFITKKVAIKLPLDEQINFNAIRQEASLWEQASGHANILPIIDADIYDGQIVIVSEYADGGSLGEKLNSEGKLAPQQAVEMTIGILNGLDYLHSQKIIHRDIKPQNILLQRDTPRLADFGISRAMEGTTNSVTVSGTDAYMAPESFEGKRNVQTDVWSVGVVLYQLLAGRLPFAQGNPHERMFAILTQEFQPLPYQIPAELKEVLQKALAKNPEKRYLSAGAMREDLKKALLEIQKPDYVPRPVVLEPSDSDLMYPGALGVTGIIPHAAWGINHGQKFYSTSDSPETVIAFYEEKFGKGEIETNSGAVKWRFNDSFNKNHKTVSVFPATAIALFSKRGDVRNVPQNTKSLIILESSPWEDGKDNSTVTDVALREIPPIKTVVQDSTNAADKNNYASMITKIPVPKTELQAKELPTVAVPFAEKTNKRRVNPLFYIGAASFVIIILLVGVSLFYYINSASFSINLPKNLHNGIKNRDLSKLISDKNTCLVSAEKTQNLWYHGQRVPNYELTNKIKPCSSSFYINADAYLNFGTFLTYLDSAKTAGADETIILASSTENNQADTKFTVKIPGQLDKFKNKPIPFDPFPMASVIVLTASGKFLLNNQPFDTLESLAKNLSDTFENRAENGKYIEGTNKVESTVFIRASYVANLDEVAKIIDTVSGARAAPILAGTREDPIVLQVDDKYTNPTPPAIPAPNNPATLKNSIGMEFVKISAGSFMMGSDIAGILHDKPVHKVTITNDFYLGKYEVTQAQWKAIMGNNRSHFKGDNLPVENISWNDAQEFIKRLNAKGEGIYRLPTEAEWEYAARAGSTGDYAGDLDSIAWYNKNSGNRTHEVGTKQANAWGLYDMQGNVIEWCQDWYGDYSGESITDPTGPTSGALYRVRRGGSWLEGDASLKLGSRDNDEPSYRHYYVGFRLLRTK